MAHRVQLNERTRKFVREVGSIVLGVLIALGIGELAEAARWDVRTRASVSAMNTELGYHQWQFLERRLMQPCIERKLEQIETLLTRARSTGKLPAVTSVGRIPARPFETGAWEVAMSLGVPLHMDRVDVTEYGGLYETIDLYPGAVGGAEMDAWAKLQLIERLEGPISDDVLGTLWEALADARHYGRLSGMVAEQAGASMNLLEVALPVDRARPDALAREVRSKDICKPLLDDGSPRPASDLSRTPEPSI